MKYIKLFIVLFFVVFATSVQAATYYVKPVLDGGDDSALGTSDATAWATISKVNSFSFSAGDDIYFKCDGVWSGTVLTVDWSGVDANNLSIIGAYFVNDGVINIGVYGNKPVINGVSNTVPTKGAWSGLIHASNRSYISIENLAVSWSGGRGICFSGGSRNSVKGCNLYSNYRNGIAFADGYSYGTAEYNKAWDNSRQRLDLGNFTAAILFAGYDNNPCTTLGSHGIARYNYLYNNMGEGIGSYKCTDNILIEKNTVINSRSGNIYIDQGKDSIIRHNLVYGYSGAPWTNASCIGIDDEAVRTHAYSENNKIYGNMVVNCDRGINLITSHVDAVLKDTEVYNNVVIDSIYGISAVNGPWENSSIKNNIVWNTGTRAGCTLAYVPATHTGLTYDYNLWSSTPTAGAIGVHDPTPTAPLLSKTTGWNTLYLGALSGSEFALQSGSTAIDSGENLCPSGCSGEYDYDTLLKSSTLDFVNMLFETVDQDSEGAGWEIGALPYETDAPEPPTGWPATLPNPVAWYKLADGTWTDGSGSGYTLTAQGTVSQATDGQGAANKAAYNAASTSNYLYRADGAPYDITGDLTIAIKAIRNGTLEEESTRLVSKAGAAGQRSYALGYEPSATVGDDVNIGHPYFWVSPDGTNKIQLNCEDTAWALNQEKSFVATHNGTTGRDILYVDGIACTTYGSGTGAIFNSTAQFQVFTSTSAASSQPIILDDLAIWNQVLTPAEVLIYQGLGTDFANDAVTPPVVITDAGTDKKVMVAGENITLFWDYNGTPTACERRSCPTTACTDVTWTAVTCADKTVTYAESTVGLRTLQIRLNESDSLITALNNWVRVRCDATSWFICPSGTCCDDSGSTLTGEAVTGIQPGASILWTGTTDLNLSALTTLGAISLANGSNGVGTLTGPGKDSFVADFSGWNGTGNLTVSGVTILNGTLNNTQ